MCVSAAGVTYGRPAHLLDAAQCIKLAWYAISDTTAVTVRMRSTSLSYSRCKVERMRI